MQVIKNDYIYITVGSTCLKDFLNGKDPRAIANFFEAFDKLNDNQDVDEDDLAYYTSGERNRESIKLILAHSHAIIKKHGWMSASKARDFDVCSTSDRVGDNMYPPYSARERSAWEKTKIDVTDYDHNVVDDCIEWAKKLDATNEYVNKVHQLCKMNSVTNAYFSTVVSIMGSYWMHLKREERKAEAAKKASQSPSEHFGDVKKRDIYNLTFKWHRSFENDYGTSTMLVFEDDDNNVAVWWKSSPAADFKLKGENEFQDFVKNTKYKARATVKAHGEYNGIKQTLINRVAIEEIL